MIDLEARAEKAFREWSEFTGADKETHTAFVSGFLVGMLSYLEFQCEEQTKQIDNIQTTAYKLWRNEHGKRN